MDQCRAERQSLAEEFRALQSTFSALGDETRQQIFIALLEHESVGMRVPQITKRTHLSRPAVSHHLRILKDAGLVNVHRQGARNYYYVDANLEKWSAMKALVDQVCRTAQAAAQEDYPRLAEGEDDFHDDHRSNAGPALGEELSGHSPGAGGCFGPAKGDRRLQQGRRAADPAGDQRTKSL